MRQKVTQKMLKEHLSRKQWRGISDIHKRVEKTMLKSGMNGKRFEDLDSAFIHVEIIVVLDHLCEAGKVRIRHRQNTRHLQYALR